jgi:hypothetical protein
MRVRRSSQREFGCNDGGGGSTAGDRYGARHGLNLLCIGSNALQQHPSTLISMMMSLSCALSLVSLPMKALDEACADIRQIPSTALKTGPPINKLSSIKLVDQSLLTTFYSLWIGTSQ